MALGLLEDISLVSFRCSPLAMDPFLLLQHASLLLSNPSFSVLVKPLPDSGSISVPALNPWTGRPNAFVGLFLKFLESYSESPYLYRYLDVFSIIFPITGLESWILHWSLWSILVHFHTGKRKESSFFSPSCSCLNCTSTLLMRSAHTASCGYVSLLFTVL